MPAAVGPFQIKTAIWGMRWSYLPHPTLAHIPWSLLVLQSVTGLQKVGSDIVLLLFLTSQKVALSGQCCSFSAAGRYCTYLPQVEWEVDGAAGWGVWVNIMIIWFPPLHLQCHLVLVTESYLEEKNGVRSSTDHQP